MAISQRRRRIRGAGAASLALVAGLVLGMVQPAAAASAPTLAVSSWRVELGSAPLGGTSAPQVVTVTNVGPGTATGLTVGTIDHPDFARTTTCGATLVQGASCTVTIVLHGAEDPDHPGEPAYAWRLGRLRISAAGGSAPLIDLEGRAGDGHANLRVNPRYTDLGKAAVGSATAPTSITITNDQPDDLDSIVTDPSDPRFEVVANGCAGHVASGATCTISVRYRPTAAGTPTGRIGLAGMRGSRVWVSSTVEVRGGGPLSVDEAFARRMYRVFFNRVPTWRQVRQLADELGSGARSKRSVVHDFLWADPWLALQVENLMYLDARVDSRTAPSLAKPYVKAIQEGQRTLASVEIELASRPGVVDYRGAAQGLAGWVEFMYSFYLGRRGDPAGLAFWTARAERLGPASVTRSFYNDPWSLRRRVNLRYSEALGRVADPDGIAYWSPRLAKRGDQDLGESLAMSPEFLRRAHTYPWDEGDMNPD